MTDTFRPEFLNRIDDVVVFDPLSRSQVGEILHKMLRGLEEQLVDHAITLEITDAAVEWLVDAGFDAAMGARPMQRAITRHVSSPLTTGILRGEIADGARVQIDADGNGLKLIPSQHAIADRQIESAGAT